MVMHADDARDSADALREIERLRMIVLAHRYLYYVVAETAVSDDEYDRIEKRLLHLLKIWPEHKDEGLLEDICPSKNVGSSLEDSYPIEVRQLAMEFLRDMNPEGFIRFFGAGT